MLQLNLWNLSEILYRIFGEKHHLLFIIYFLKGCHCATTHSVKHKSKHKGSLRQASRQGPIGTVPSTEIVNKTLGGQVVNEREMPWMLKLEIFTDQEHEPQLCGGFLIDWQWALTAGHCVENAQMVTVTAGRTNFSVSDPAKIVLNISSQNIFIHPSYSRSTDIALIRLPGTFRDLSLIRPICILNSWNCQNFPQIQSEEENNCGITVAAGWGTTESKMESTILQTINMTAVSTQLCNRVYTNRLLGSTHICAVGKPFQTPYGEMHTDTCLGDSGGPLMCKVNGSMTAVGIVSFGMGCGTGQPGVYTRICSYKDWILETMNTSGCRVPGVQHGYLKTVGSNQALYPGSSLSQGTNITIICKQNYSPNITSGASETVSCQANGQWFPALAECTFSNVMCGSVPLILNGRLHTLSFTVGSEAVALCNEGYNLEGDNILRCLGNSQWSTANGRCVLDESQRRVGCGTPPTIPNGSVLAGGGTSRNVTCNDGYRLTGGNKIFCLPSSQWSEPGQCQKG